MQNKTPHICPLCSEKSNLFYKNKLRDYYLCEGCAGIFMDKNQRPTKTEEKVRYLEHNNDVYDEGYRTFVSPITSSIFNDFTSQHTGLDFGSGKSKIITTILQEQNYNVSPYDPIFNKQTELLNESYNYIACCEVMEHFHYPFREFERLKQMLKPHGALYCMTDIYNPNINFDKWYYKNDATHVFIYQKKTLEWILKSFGFKKMIIQKRLIIFTK